MAGESITLTATVTYSVQVEVQVSADASPDAARFKILQEAAVAVEQDIQIKDGVITECSDPALED